MAVPPGLGALGSLAMNSGKPAKLNTLPLPWDEFSLLTKQGEDNTPLYQRDSRGQMIVDIVFDVAMLKVSTYTLRRRRGCLRVRWMDPFLVGTRGDNTSSVWRGKMCIRCKPEWSPKPFPCIAGGKKKKKEITDEKCYSKVIQQIRQASWSQWEFQDSQRSAEK